MADIKKIKLPDGNTYNVKAENAEKIRCDLITASSTGSYYPLVVNSTNTAAEYQEMAVPNHGPKVDVYNGELKASQIVTDFAAIGNTTDGYATISPTQSYFPNGIITDNVLCSSMSVGDIADLYTATKTSGNWSCTIDESIAYRTGNVIQFDLLFKGNGNAVSGPTNAFVGAISGGPLPVTQTIFCGYYNAVAVMGILDTDGSLSVRPLGTITLTSSNRCHLRATYICS